MTELPVLGIRAYLFTRGVLDHISDRYTCVHTIYGARGFPYFETVQDITRVEFARGARARTRRVRQISLHLDGGFRSSVIGAIIPRAKVTDKYRQTCPFFDRATTLHECARISPPSFPPVRSLVIHFAFRARSNDVTLITRIDCSC